MRVIGINLLILSIIVLIFYGLGTIWSGEHNYVQNLDEDWQNSNNQNSYIEIKDYGSKHGLSIGFISRKNQITLSNASKKIDILIDSDFAVFNQEYIYWFQNPIHNKNGNYFASQNDLENVISFNMNRNNPEQSSSYSENTSDEVIPAISSNSSTRSIIKYVFIDPGHGGNDPGTFQAIYGIKEKDVVLSVSLLVEKILKKRGVSAKIILTRRSDVFITLSQRTEMAEKVTDSGASGVFISIHANGTLSSLVKGIETYYYSARPGMNSSTIDQYRRNELSNKYSLSNKSSYKGVQILMDMLNQEISRESSMMATFINTNLFNKVNRVTENRGVKHAHYQVISYINMPSVLVEVGFLSNKDEVKHLTLSDYQMGIAEGIADGIISFLNQYKNTNAFEY